jgi:predicted DsbA family dithiol-disulfide isomerase
MAFKKEQVEIIEPKDVFVGNPKAEVTLEEFGEYESEDCAKANDIVKQLLQDYEGKIRFNFRHFPMTRIHQRSLKAGEAAVATAQEGKFWEMHNILFANRRNLGTTSLKLHSKEAGVKNKHFLDDLVNATYGWHVQGDMKEGLQRGVKDVPTFFVNGVRITGKPTYQELSKAIDSALKKHNQKTTSLPVAKKQTVKNDVPAKTKVVSVSVASKKQPVIKKSTAGKKSATVSSKNISSKKPVTAKGKKK